MRFINIENKKMSITIQFMSLCPDNCCWLLGFFFLSFAQRIWECFRRSEYVLLYITLGCWTGSKIHDLQSDRLSSPLGRSVMWSLPFTMFVYSLLLLFLPFPSSFTQLAISIIIISPIWPWSCLRSLPHKSFSCCLSGGQPQVAVKRLKTILI